MVVEGLSWVGGSSTKVLDLVVCLPFHMIIINSKCHPYSAGAIHGHPSLQSYLPLDIVSCSAASRYETQLSISTTVCDYTSDCRSAQDSHLGSAATCMLQNGLHQASSNVFATHHADHDL